ncbi:putative KIN28-cyclin-dependent ser/thr protein kinase [Rhizophagus irregularis]|uniref:Putative cyclin-dependent kinase 7 n=2 Tax=Rhizophagus irregularis TaxID=588596 RepID=U9SUA0_RHIID|nr:putative cyclin-dependent kinase 7 [Rhizophagus irregularis DAOM 181602=DAOM 197198]PKC12905.1 putative KIN28-cyclin-dependent ser/thr protein kinase [Rhizophagus irregularis]PKC74941.1 putative KIN28-cyclin-dependent ser/thr protein kinase [Rhizophagus irregularis]PKK77084.1 putative KIN28-cyclin-dependent ser/thr protein kinase [Rhizophagus irregularis]PKY14103.1 putative KIN28-cyclin-dependent ser/thr protein kinase [Rhizophagus irregularis]POG67489.1 putative cyclin-dependent kinase 7 [|eukprot:XP_025174355.1 putative cyclin-dependent kinase 7 [Rhizophagus irregularis DAOM 181602=DAOM 197198]
MSSFQAPEEEELQIENKYLKEKKIGEGTYAKVYRGTERATGRTVAIKKIKLVQTEIGSQGIELSAVREVKCLRELRHPNVIELIDIYSHKSNLKLVLEYLDSDLEMIIKDKSILFQAPDIKSWMLMTLRGLDHCHRNWILHRDMKPNNLLVGKDGQLKIADFGLARDYGDPHAKNMSPQVVTRWYRAPELFFMPSQYGYAVDIWSVGCIFAELLLRTPYLAGESDLAQLELIFKALGTPTEEDWPGFSELARDMKFQKYSRTPLQVHFKAAGSDAIDLLEKMLTYDPNKRINTREALLHSYFRKLPRPTPPDQLPKQQKIQENAIQQNSKPSIQNRGELTEHRNKRKAQEISNKSEKKIHRS